MTLVLDIITTASVLFVVAAGLLAIFGVLKIINFAHGAWLTVGAYCAVLVAGLGWNPWLALPLAFLVGAVLGGITEMLIVRPLYRRPLDAILATWGLGIVLGQLITLWFGRDVQFTPNLLPGTVELFGFTYSGYRLFMILAALVIGGGLVVWALLGKDFRTPDGLLAGVGLGGVIAWMWWISGHLGFVPEHPETLESVYLATNSGRMESLTFTAPMAYLLDWLVHYSDTSKVLTLGVVTVVGVVVGSFIQALLSRSFRWEGFRDTQDTALHLAGAACMGVGGVTAMGCTVGQGLSGLSTLSLTSAIAVAGIMVGAVLGFRFQIWLLERE